MITIEFKQDGQKVAELEINSQGQQPTTQFLYLYSYQQGEQKKEGRLMSWKKLGMRALVADILKEI